MCVLIKLSHVPCVAPWSRGLPEIYVWILRGGINKVGRRSPGSSSRPRDLTGVSCFCWWAGLGRPELMWYLINSQSKKKVVGGKYLDSQERTEGRRGWQRTRSQAQWTWGLSRLRKQRQGLACCSWGHRGGRNWAWATGQTADFPRFQVGESRPHAGLPKGAMSSPARRYRGERISVSQEDP